MEFRLSVVFGLFTEVSVVGLLTGVEVISFFSSTTGWDVGSETVTGFVSGCG
jgi:hypothetical protein